MNPSQQMADFATLARGLAIGGGRQQSLLRTGGGRRLDWRYVAHELLDAIFNRRGRFFRHGRLFPRSAAKRIGQQEQHDERNPDDRPQQDDQKLFSRRSSDVSNGPADYGGHDHEPDEGNESELKGSASHRHSTLKCREEMRRKAARQPLMTPTGFEPVSRA